jgi:hypothetical protein
VVLDLRVAGQLGGAVLEQGQCALVHTAPVEDLGVLAIKYAQGFVGGWW